MTSKIDSFGDEMSRQGIKPLLKRKDRVLPAPRSSQQSPGLDRCREAAIAEIMHENALIPDGQIQWFGPHDIVEYKRTGIQLEVFKNLKGGRYKTGASLDLHRLRVEEARVALLGFVKDCGVQGIRYALILHGKGWHTPRGKEKEEAKERISQLKSHAVHWLKSMDVVQAFSSAQPRDGGTGALYVLFKKSKKE